MSVPANIVRRAIKRGGGAPHNLLVVLQEIVKSGDSLSNAMLLEVAKAMDMPPAHVYGVASFYSFLECEPRGKFIIRVCQTISCFMQGKEAVISAIENFLGVSMGQTTPDGRFTLKAANCMGWCHKGPVMLINDEVYTGLTPEKVKAILAEYLINRKTPRREPLDTEGTAAGTAREPLPESVLTRQNRVNMIFAESDVWPSLARALDGPPKDIISKIKDSGLRGRGGAGFPTGIKWESARQAAGTEKYVVCNADEGEPGTFKDREILTRQSLKVLAGMALCAKATGAERGFIYLRGEYNFLKKSLNKTLATFHRWLARRNCSFKVSVFSGSGAYVCGEETALFESMEGKRGEPRNKPPYPTARGLPGLPTVINNVETLVYAAMIMEIGSEAFKKLGTQDSRGAKVFCVSGDTPRPGIYELELGMTVSEFVTLFGDGHTKAVQVGGSSGFCVSRRDFDNTILGFEGIPTGGAVILFNSSRSMYHVLTNFLEFFCEESCGQCTPCRVGCQQLLQGIEAIKDKTKPKSYLNDLQQLAATMRLTAKCGLGQSVGNSFNSITTNYVEELYY